ncbi:MAG: B12-binding domain-containing radical SAM protein, partial [Chlorobiaceae bacterium]|nr:B12-binding domain-containing radical SAM protein [Chlorobiaceae bacterium]
MQTEPAEIVTAPFAPAAGYSEDLLQQLASRQKFRKKWLLIQPKSNTSMMVDSGTVSMPLNLIMVATIAGKLFDITFIDER